ncbi:MAG: hypothetical protein ACRCXB_20065 [Aeromonadaceae bacterium]
MIITERNRAGILCYLQHPQPKSCPKEEVEQAHLMQLIKAHTPWTAPLVWHTVNEGMAKPQYRHAMAVAGMVSGVADIISIYSGPKHLSCAIEVKRSMRSKSSISKEQKEFLLAHDARGGFAAAAYGAHAGWHAWLDYLGIYDLSMRSKADHLI